MKSEEYKKLSLREFDKAAAKFDDNDPSVYNMCRKDYPDVLAEAVSEPFSDLLDAGCGTGAMLGMFKKDYPNKNYTGIDLSEKMIETAKKKHPEGIQFITGDCESLPFPNDSFDAVTCSMSFHHYPDPEKFFMSLHCQRTETGKIRSAERIPTALCCKKTVTITSPTRCP